MRLTEKQKRILAVVQLEREATFTEVALRAGVQVNTVRNFLLLMRNKELIRPYVNVDLRKLGYTEYGIRFGIIGENSAQRMQIENFLVETKAVGGIGLYAAEYSHGVLYYAKSLQELDTFLCSMSSHVPHMAFRRRDVSIRTWWVSFPCKYLLAKAPGRETLGWPREIEPIEIDDLDRNILRALTVKPDRSNRDLAQYLKIPRTTLDNRIRVLEENGTIAGYGYWINIFNMGYQMFRLLLYGNVDSKALNDLLKYAQGHSHITGFARCIGPWEVELRVEVENAEAAMQIARDTICQFKSSLCDVGILPYIRNLKTSFVPY